MLTKHQTAFDMMNALRNAYEVNNATRVLALKATESHSDKERRINKLLFPKSCWH